MEDWLTITDGTKKVTRSFDGVFDLTPLVKDNPLSLRLAKEHLKYSSYSRYSYWLWTIGYFGTVALTLQQENNLIFPISSLIYILGVMNTASYFRGKARKALYDSINNYNGIKIQPSDSTSSSFKNLRDTRLVFDFNF